MEYTDLVITIDRTREGLVVSCPDSEGGSIFETMNLPFEEAVVEEVRILVEQEGLTAAEASIAKRPNVPLRPSDSRAESVLERRGAAMFDAVFHGKIKEA